MATPIVMPSFGMYTAEGTLVAWLHANGSDVEAGQIIAEIETEKAVQELLAPAGGTLHHVAAVGALLKEEGVVGYILAPGEVPPAEAKSPVAPAPGAVAAAPAPRGVASGGGTGPPRASPIAKKLAAQNGIDLATLSGSGPNGRIVEADVKAAIGRADRARAADAPAAGQRVPLTGMRRAIGERLRRSADTAVSLTLTREVEADALVAARNKASADGPVSVPFDAYFAKLLAAALREHPELNSTIEGDELVIFADVNVAVAVSLPQGLLVPVVRRADETPLREVGERIRHFAAKARAQGLAPADLAGGTCTITNLGASGVDAFTPVLNPPQSCILGIGRIQPRVVVRNGAPAVASTCMLSLTFDHRVADGAAAARILSAIARSMNDEGYLTELAAAPTAGALP